MNNNHLLIAGSFYDTLYLNNNLTGVSTATSVVLLELDHNRSPVFIKTMALKNPKMYDFVECTDELKDEFANCYYVLVNLEGSLQIDTSNTINASMATILVKFDNTGKMLWYYYLGNSTPASMCFDNYGNVIVLTTNNVQIILLNINKNTGQLRRYEIGTSNGKISASKIINNNGIYILSCNYKDSIYFNHQKIKGNKASASIIRLDSMFNVINYNILSAGGYSLQINDFILDNHQNIYLTGFYNGFNLYVDDTIRLSRPSPNTYLEQMFVIKLKYNYQFLWAKQERNNPYNNKYYGTRQGYKIITDNNDVYALGYYNNSLIIGNDTLYGSSLILMQYDANGQYIQSEKIAGNYLNGNYTLNFNFTDKKITLSVGFNNSLVSVCQNTINLMGITDVYITELDKIMSVPLNSDAPYSQFILYPNPSHDYLYIQHLPLNCTYEIYDVLGHCIYKSNSACINVSTFTNGVYLLKSMDKTFKFIVQH
ncbi:MAG: T9SS type A sorting domain-containing protein [Bacteroidia bacterium]|nr:T9SS type A sorting domain-containing protein [Bacteroidia bacterium]